MTEVSQQSELVRIDNFMQERKIALMLPAVDEMPPAWVFLEDLLDVNVERLRGEIIDILKDNRCKTNHIPGILTFIRKTVEAIDGTWIHDVLPKITYGTIGNVKERVECAVLNNNGSFHVSLKQWLALSGRNRLYQKQGTYRWCVRAVAGETAKIKEALGFLRSCLELALAWSNSGDSAHAVALEVVDREWHRVMGGMGVDGRPELLRVALDGQRQSVCDQCTFAVELFRHLSGPQPPTGDMERALGEACEEHGIDPRQLLHCTRLSVLHTLDRMSGVVAREAVVRPGCVPVGKYLLMDHGYRLSADAQEMTIRLFGFSLQTAVEGRANCRLLMETEVGSISPHRETLWSGIVEGQVQVRFERMMKRRMGSSGAAVVRLLQDDGVELSHQTLRFPDPSVSFDGRLLSPGRWALPDGELVLAATASLEPQASGFELRPIRRPNQGNPGLWHLRRGSNLNPMVLRLRGASGMREWRFDRMLTGCSVALSLDRGDGVHLYTDDDHGAPVVDGATTRLRLTVTGDEGLVPEDAMTGILERISIGWRCDAREGRTAIGEWTHARVVVDGDRKHLDIPLKDVLPLARSGVRQCVFRIVGVAGSADRLTGQDVSCGGDRFEVLELPRCHIRIVPRCPGRSGFIEGVGRENVTLFRLDEDKPSGTSGRPTADVVPLRGRFFSRGIQLRAMSIVPNVGIWPHAPMWDAPALLRNLLEDVACAKAYGVGGTSIRIRMREADSLGPPILDERLEFGTDVDGDVPFGALLPIDLVDRPVWNRLLGNGMFIVEYESDVGSIGRIDVDARATPTSMAMISADAGDMTMRLRIDGHPGSPRSIICKTWDRNGGTLADMAVTFGFEGDRAAWLRSVDRVFSRTVGIRIHRSTTSVVLVDASTSTVLLSMPVSVALPDAQQGLPDPPWSIDELTGVLEVVRWSPTPWSERPFKSAVAEAIDKAVDKQVRTFLNILQAWLWQQPQDVTSTDARALSSAHIDAAATMWLDLAMDLRVPPHPGFWEQALRDASTTHTGRLLHVFDSLRHGVDFPWDGPLVESPCRVRNRRLARIAGYLE